MSKPVRFQMPNVERLWKCTKESPAINIVSADASVAVGANLVAECAYIDETLPKRTTFPAADHKVKVVSVEKVKLREISSEAHEFLRFGLLQEDIDRDEDEWWEGMVSELCDNGTALDQIHGLIEENEGEKITPEIILFAEILVELTKIAIEEGKPLPTLDTMVQEVRFCYAPDGKGLDPSAIEALRRQRTAVKGG